MSRCYRCGQEIPDSPRASYLLPEAELGKYSTEWRTYYLHCDECRSLRSPPLFPGISENTAIGPDIQARGPG